MAYKKEYPVVNSELEKDSIFEYTKRQEDRIESEFNNILSEGADKNGRWVKFRDGTMICSGNLVLNQTSWAVRQNDSLDGEWTFPQPFLVTPQIVGTVIWKILSNPTVRPYDYQIVQHAGFSNREKCRFRAICAEKSFADNHTLEVETIAMGRWK